MVRSSSTTNAGWRAPPRAQQSHLLSRAVSASQHIVQQSSRVFGTPPRRQSSGVNVGGRHTSAGGTVVEERDSVTPAYDSLSVPAPASRASSVAGRTRMCTICMDYVAAHEACTLPCSHAFHLKCVSEMREFGVREVCPMCRKRVGDESQPGQELFEEGCRSFVPLARRVERGEAAWDNLSMLQQREMETATSLWRKAAKLGLPAAQCSLGSVHLDGRGVAQSDSDAMAWFEQAAVQGHPNALFKVALLYRDGRAGTPASDEEAAVRFLAAAEKGHAEAQFSLGTACLKGFGVPKNERNAMRWYQRAAAQGHAKAQFNLACLYQLFGGFGDHGGDSTFSSDGNSDPLPGGETLELPMGDGDATAAYWYRKAAELGHAAAQFNLGCMCEDGVGVRASDAEAAHWYRQAAEQGHVKAQFNLGCLLERAGVIYNKFTPPMMGSGMTSDVGDLSSEAPGSGSSKNETSVAITSDVENDTLVLGREALDSTTTSDASTSHLAEGTCGSPVAAATGERSSFFGASGPVVRESERGSTSSHSSGDAEGCKEAAEWYRRAGAQGHAGALFNLGLLYEHGRGVLRDHGKALALLCQAAAEGHEEAQQQARQLKSGPKGNAATGSMGTASSSSTAAENKGNNRKSSVDSRVNSQQQKLARGRTTTAPAMMPSSAGMRVSVKASGRQTTRASKDSDYLASKRISKESAVSTHKPGAGWGSRLDGLETSSQNSRPRTSSLDKRPPLPGRDTNHAGPEKTSASGRPTKPRPQDGRFTNATTADRGSNARLTKTSTTIATTTTTTVISLEIDHGNRSRGYSLPSGRRAQGSGQDSSSYKQKDSNPT